VIDGLSHVSDKVNTSRGWFSNQSFSESSLGYKLLIFKCAIFSPQHCVKSLTERLGGVTGPGFSETSPAREISRSANDAERAKRQLATASSLFVSDGDVLQELIDLLESYKSYTFGWLTSLATCKMLLSVRWVGSSGI